MVETWPEGLKPTHAEFWLRSHSATFQSPFTRTVQVLDLGVPQWIAVFRFRLHSSRAGMLDALLARLRGPQGQVRLWDPQRVRPASGVYAGAHRGAEIAPEPFTDGNLFSDGTGFTVSGTPHIVQGAVKGAKTLRTAGWYPDRTVLAAGDKLQAGDWLYMAVADVVADGNGEALVSFEPGLRVETGADAFFIVERPASRFRLLDDDQARNPGGWNQMIEYELRFIEDLAAR